jgi:hypothetical protein
MNGEKLHSAIFWGSFGSFLASLCLPSIMFASHSPVFGITVLLWGWWGVLSGGNFAWFANFLFLSGIAGFRDKEYLLAAITGTLAIPLALTSFYAKEWWFNEGFGTPISGLGPGFYLWILGMLTLCVGTLSIPKNGWTRDPTTRDTQQD